MSHAQAAVAFSLNNLINFNRPLSIFGVPVERGTIFTDHRGVYKPRIEKRQRRLIVQTTFVKFYLQGNERILFLTTGHSPINALEQVLTGPVALYFKRAIFVFTDRRMLSIPARSGHGKPSALSQVLYEDCARFELKGHCMVIDYKNGQQESFPFMRRKERKKLKRLIGILPLNASTASPPRQRTYLCPSCTNELKSGESICPVCKMAFKSGLKARIRSLCIPGGGYLYSHFTLPGITVGLLEIFLLSYLCYNLAAFKTGVSVNLGLTAIFGVLYLCEKMITAFHAQQLAQAFIPEERDFAMRKI